MNFVKTGVFFMTRKEVNKIVRQGGDALNKLNKEVAEYLDELDLSSDARSIIAGTDFNLLADCFGGYSAEEIEEIVKEY